MAVMNGDNSALESEGEHCEQMITSSTSRRQSKTKKNQQNEETESEDDNDDAARDTDTSDTEDDDETENVEEVEQQEQKNTEEKEKEKDKTTDYTPSAVTLKHTKSRLSAVNVKVQNEFRRQSRLALSLPVRQSSHNLSHKARRKSANASKLSDAPDLIDENLDIKTALLCSCRTIAYGDMVECMNVNVSVQHDCMQNNMRFNCISKHGLVTLFLPFMLSLLLLLLLCSARTSGSIWVVLN
jgi:hypothetical protein